MFSSFNWLQQLNTSLYNIKLVKKLYFSSIFFLFARFIDRLFVASHSIGVVFNLNHQLDASPDVLCHDFNKKRLHKCV